ncbi:TlyA family RNA methyltransferase [Microbacterium marinilacus]|uniref:TlyA family rRNA (Cytidine-2'-O)-methyltransferase n=1 Tax=Microbacterium marinilacus TaxID=415209 RepID=A0ABP7BLP1_9MICO|nr:TlyA family RNA methyltransferase [Microbacterium marinilacus]MBY0688872.1 TlyA family RNA methyltransferase [Microbacterium marinilacus]
MSSRLDAALAARGLARSRSHAASLIEEGRVTVAGRVAAKASMKVDDDTQIAVSDADHYVSRGAQKLIGALDGFGIAAAGRVALDMGASTGGFTQVLRERGAEPVIAVDVGHGQLALLIALDAGVRAVEGFNVRHMTAQTLVEASGVTEAPSLIVGDLSFISLTHVLPAVAEVASGDADVVLLVKPQFEVGRTRVRGGVVTDPGLRADAVMEVLFTAHDLGLGTLGVLPSPLRGTHGNVEALIHIAPGRGTDPTQWKTTVERCCAG